MKPRANSQTSKHRPRGFESLEPRYALDGADSFVPRLPDTYCPPAPPLLGMIVYAAPIGPAPVLATPTLAAAASLTSTLPPISLAYIQRLNSAPLPIGPARPTALPSQQQTPIAAIGVLPTITTPIVSPTTQQSLAIDLSPSDVPTYSLF